MRSHWRWVSRLALLCWVFCGDLLSAMTVIAVDIAKEMSVVHICSPLTVVHHLGYDREGHM
jgi:hypothetical protein